MNYSIHFFANNATNLMQATARGRLLNNVELKLRNQNQFKDEEILSTMTQAEAICQGNLPKDCDVEWFDAFCWIMDAMAEKIQISSFLGFRHLGYLEDIGIWPWMLRTKPPFAVPVCADPPPQVGYLSSEDMARIVVTGFPGLPAKRSREVAYARQEFQEVLETLVDDNLDLVAVLV